MDNELKIKILEEENKKLRKLLNDIEIDDTKEINNFLIQMIQDYNLLNEELKGMIEETRIQEQTMIKYTNYLKNEYKELINIKEN